MEPHKLPESDINTLNEKLKTIFGIDVVTGLPIWRVVWSDDQFEKRFGTFDDITPAGIFLRTVTEVREVPKYKHYISARYILERLVVVPDVQQKEICTKISYEPIWTFEDKAGNWLAPKWNACEFIIQLVYSVQHGSKMSRYEDDESDQEKSLALKEKRIEGLVEELFGDQSSLGGGTYLTGDTVIVPRNFEKAGK